MTVGVGCAVGATAATPWLAVRTWLARRLCPDGYCPIAETHPRATRCSPLDGGYDPVAVRAQVLGRESATCEACGTRVRVAAGGDLAAGAPSVLRNLVPNVWTVPNKVLLCVDCAARPDAAWRRDVRARRAATRPGPPSVRALVGYWLVDPTAWSLFVRRVAAAGIGFGLLLATLALAAAGGGWLAGGATLARQWVTAVLAVVLDTGGWLHTHGWVTAGLCTAGVVVHTLERVRHDPRSYRSRRWRPWLAVGAGGLAVAIATAGQAGLETGLLPASVVASVVVAAVWGSGAVTVAWHIDRAVRHDLLVTQWQPRRLRWVVAGCVGGVPGALLLGGVPPPPWLAPVPDGARLALLALPAGVAVAFVGGRLPYAEGPRDAVLAALPARVRAWFDDA